MKTEKQTIQIDGNGLTITDVIAVMNGAVEVELSDTAKQHMQKSRDWVEDCVTKQKNVYGITTGFGKFSDTTISFEQLHRLQENLIKSHACGVGNPFPIEVVRGIMLLRANALAKGYSGARTLIVQLLLNMLNSGVHPVIPEQGSLGASGDLAPLSHMALVMIGLGEAEFKGNILSGKEALSQAGLQPVQLASKEGLALINGTQAMTSLLCKALFESERLIRYAHTAAAMTVEALRGIPAAFHPLIQAVRPHHGQIVSASTMLKLLEGSNETSQPGELRVQDAYSIRCIPQVYGATIDTFEHVRRVVETEVNAATDNPLIFPDDDMAISGGNFHGQPLALVADFLAIAMAELGNMSERRTERLVNPALNGDLPAFLTSQGGLNSGFMIPQYVAASLVSENKLLASPASVDSIPSSANQEDHVSMGTIGARKVNQLLGNVYCIIAIEMMCAGQGIEFGQKRLGKGTKVAYEWVRSLVKPLDEDRELYVDINRITEGLKTGDLDSRIKDIIKEV